MRSVFIHLTLFSVLNQGVRAAAKMVRKKPSSTQLKVYDPYYRSCWYPDSPHRIPYRTYCWGSRISDDFSTVLFLLFWLVITLLVELLSLLVSNNSRREWGEWARVGLFLLWKKRLYFFYFCLLFILQGDEGIEWHEAEPIPNFNFIAQITPSSNHGNFFLIILI